MVYNIIFMSNPTIVEDDFVIRLIMGCDNLLELQL